MLSIHLKNTKNKGISYTTYEEETILAKLYDKTEIKFIKKLWENYYNDPIFSFEELEIAYKELFALSVEMIAKATTSPEIDFVYKMIAIVSYAVFHKENLYCISD
ncbi:hypothetical protein CGC56_06935 [Capnocytophaga canimorsus]|uniref:Uncharacterized protein n=2 Tax=Flavobacteriales TaxID=200644 RepID=A0A250G585_9FLAO|nr:MULTISPECIES: hypothetical protein [Flavobacteriales]ATA91925.1 hypothetical protein CGC56_06935 [Capnocytophaga canimorsus]EKB60163.1 hypothetical protein HMPREF9700_01200 [Bergeyella zoohelcum CCUG 30536]SUV52937.1 Uncharacterised protein [Bergeyella zoohelcum]